MLQPHLSAAPILALLLCGACCGQPTPTFAPAKDCALCHSRIPPPDRSRWRKEPSVAPHALWQGSMMANAAKDPFWRVKVRYESEQAGEDIERKCLRCHAPAKQIARMSELDAANEGVTCTVCHQISSKGLGTRGSLTGGFQFETGGIAFGPHKDPFTMPMQHRTDLTPAYGPHVLEAAFCGTCHTVVTHPMDTPPGTEFVEQAPFLEWLASSWPREGRACQSCHMPQLENDAGEPTPSYIAHRPPGGPFPPTSRRTPFGLHFFAGGNYHLPMGGTGWRSRHEGGTVPCRLAGHGRERFRSDVVHAGTPARARRWCATPAFHRETSPKRLLLLQGFWLWAPPSVWPGYGTVSTAGRSPVTPD